MLPHPGVHRGSTLCWGAVDHACLCVVTEVLKEGLVATQELSFLNEYPALLKSRGSNSCR